MTNRMNERNGQGRVLWHPFTLLATVVMFLLAACASQPQRPTIPEPAREAPKPIEPLPEAPPLTQDIRIGILLPLSGQHAEVGEALLNAASLAAFDTGDRRLVLVPRDTQGTALGAEHAAQQLMAEGVHVIAGPLLAPEVRSVAPIAREQGIDVIAFSTDRSVAGQGVHLLSFAPEEEVRRVVTYAASRGHKSFAALVPQTPYGATVARAFARAVEQAGGEVADIVHYPPDTAQLFQPVRQITRYDERKRNLERERAFLRSLGEDDLAAEILDRMKPLEALGEVPYDAVMIAEGASLLRVLAPLLPYYEVDPKDVQFLGTGLWNDPTIIREPQLIGGWFAAPPQDRASAFAERYRTLYGREAPRIATLGYDAVALIASLVRGGATPPFDPAALTDPNGFDGIDGVFRFLGNGETERGLAVMGVTRRGFTTLSPAPRSFIEEPSDEDFSQ